MTRETSEGTCDSCTRTFAYYLIHNGFNESCYAYCSVCGMTAVIDTRYEDRTAEGFPRHRSITSAAEQSMAPCPCGGSFKAGAAPRCTHCTEKLSATAASGWIEASVAGSAQGWRWQGDWEGLYAIVIEDRLVSNPLRTESTPS